MFFLNRVGYFYLFAQVFTVMSNSERGPKPRFHEEHLWEALEIIEGEGPLGRKQIAEKLGLGEGSTRTILGKLKDRGLITSTPEGHSIKKKGMKKLEERSKRLVSLDAGELTVGEVDVAVVIENAASKVRSGIEQRDEALKAGADGATVLIFEGQELRFPGADERVGEDIANKFRAKLDFSDGDAIIISSGRNKIKARLGALAASRSLEN